MNETLLSAARRAIRFFNIDMNKGGIITVETQIAMETLDRMIRKESANGSNPTPPAPSQPRKVSGD